MLVINIANATPSGYAPNKRMNAEIKPIIIPKVILPGFVVGLVIGSVTIKTAPNNKPPDKV